MNNKEARDEKKKKGGGKFVPVSLSFTFLVVVVPFDLGGPLGQVVVDWRPMRGLGIGADGGRYAISQQPFRFELGEAFGSDGGGVARLPLVLHRYGERKKRGRSVKNAWPCVAGFKHKCATV